MLDFCFAEHCCGCSACKNVCPVNAIEMKPDEAGFLFPIITKEKCIQCGRCDRVCPHVNAAKTKKPDQKAEAWLYASANDEAKMRSASGAAFYELAQAAIENGGYVFGCVWNDNLKAVHIGGNTQETLQRMQGSKYVQSDMGTCFNEMIALLKEKKHVLFSGTPCQVTAAHQVCVSVLGEQYRDYLLTVGVLCHGVAAPLAWESYKQWLEKKNGSKLSYVNFRDKHRQGYQKSFCRYQFESGKTVDHPTFLPTSKYIESTLVYNLGMRKSCGQCDCKGITEACDLILGDWYAANTGEGRLGTSCVVAFTERGSRFAAEHLHNLRPEAYETIVRDNGYIENSVVLGRNRDEFLRSLKNSHFWNHVERLYPPKYLLKKILCKTGLYEVLKRI